MKREKSAKMPYGKYKGKYIHELPSGYLRWIAENWKEDTYENQLICTEADKEYRHRDTYNTHHLYE